MLQFHKTIGLGQFRAEISRNGSGWYFVYNFLFPNQNGEQLVLK
jgi:hypothetical protein